MRGGSRARCSERAVTVSHDEVRVKAQCSVYKYLYTHKQNVSDTEAHMTSEHNIYNSMNVMYGLPYPQRHISQ